MKEKIEQDLKDLIVRVINIRNSMENGKFLHADKKLLGVHQKLYFMLKYISSSDPDLGYAFEKEEVLNSQNINE